MQVENRLRALQERHSRIDTQLQEEVAHSAADPKLVQDLKRQKLSLKDEIRSLKVRAA